MRAARPERGFSLIEIMVAVAVFGIAVSGLMTLLVTSTKANASAADTANASSLADSWLEQFKARQETWRGSVGVGVALEAPELGVPQNAWTLPLPSSGDPWAVNVAHDAEGRVPTDANARKAIYCVHYRTNWLPAGVTAVGGSDEVQVTVRVAYTSDSGEEWPNCSVATVDAQLADGGTARAIVIPTVVRSNR